MNWQNQGYNLGNAALLAMQDRSTLHGLASLCQRARHARAGLGSQNQPPTKDSLDGGQGDSNSNSAS